MYCCSWGIQYNLFVLTLELSANNNSHLQYFLLSLSMRKCSTTTGCAESITLHYKDLQCVDWSVDNFSTTSCRCAFMCFLDLSLADVDVIVNIYCITLSYYGHHDLHHHHHHCHHWHLSMVRHTQSNPIMNNYTLCSLNKQ